MIYYIIFCITTTIITITRCQYPVIKEIRPELVNNLIFWTALTILDLLFAIPLFLVTIFVPEKYMMNMATTLYEGKNKS